jgi:hypothetical protein
MKIESQVYSRYPINDLQKSAEQSEGARRNAAQAAPQTDKFDKTLADIQTSKVENNRQTQSARSGSLSEQLPQNLEEVLSLDEQAMLKQMFPSAGSNWGVNAYETQGISHNSIAVGHKLDVVS